MTESSSGSAAAAETGTVLELAGEDNPLETGQAIRLMEEQDTLLMRENAEEGHLVYSYYAPDGRGGTRKEWRLTYLGVKQMVLEQADRGNVISAEENPVVELVKFDDDDRGTWVWQAWAAVRSLQTRMRTIGMAESPFESYDKKEGKVKYDSFGRTSACSKAMRNAYRLQVPEPAIQMFLQNVGKKANVIKGATSTVTVDGDDNKKPKAIAAASQPPPKPAKKKADSPAPKKESRKDSIHNALRSVGYKGKIPDDESECIRLINELAGNNTKGAAAAAQGKQAETKPAASGTPKAKNKDWESHPATNAQIGKLKALGVDDNDIPETKGEASDMISSLLEEAEK